MPLNAIIRQKRKELGLTQEQIAEYLGVSTPAVNKWERGTTYPDISLLSPLARLLQVDLNTLLCFNKELTEQEINHFSNKIAETISQEGLDAGFKLAAEKILEYPNCALLLHSLAILLDGSLIMSELLPEEKEPYQAQIISWYERAADCDDEKVKNNAIFMLTSKYIAQERYERAQELIDNLPEKSTIDKRVLQANLFSRQSKTMEAIEITERRLLQAITELHGILLILTDFVIATGNLDRASQIAEIASETTNLFNLWGYTAFVAPLQVAIAKEDMKESLSLLKSLLSSAIEPWNIQSSPLYHCFPAKDTGEYGKKILLPLLTELENSPQYAFLQSNVEFQKLIEGYRKMQ